MFRFLMLAMLIAVASAFMAPAMPSKISMSKVQRRFAASPTRLSLRSHPHPADLDAKAAGEVIQWDGDRPVVVGDGHLQH